MTEYMGIMLLICDANLLSLCKKSEHLLVPLCVPLSLWVKLKYRPKKMG